MITIHTIYDALGYQRPQEFAEARELKNVRRIKRGEIPCHELFRQTGRSTFILVCALSLVSMGKKVAIKVSSYAMKRRQEMSLRNMAMDVVRQNRDIRELDTENIFLYANDMELVGRHIDVCLDDTFDRDLNMHSVGFYI